MNIIELARNAGMVKAEGEAAMFWYPEIERFATLVIAEHVKSVDVAPVAWEGISNSGTPCVCTYKENAEEFAKQTSGSVRPLFTAEQMAAVRHKALEEAAQVCVEIALKPSNVILGVAIECAEAIRELKGKK